ncbi:MAG TPA: sucrase ferredoxin [Anaerolineales bacterium]
MDNVSTAYCSTLSLEAGEDLFGTASHAKVYFLLEYHGIWGVKAFQESDLPDVVKSRLSTCLADIPGSKLLLIKGFAAQAESGPRFFIASASEHEPRLYGFQLQGYQDLLSLDIHSLLDGSSAYEAARIYDPLYLVCTNGHRDVCCARYGSPVYLDLLKTSISSVWQSTHMGGHRFAANLLCLPHGIQYGRLDAGQAQAVLESHRAGKLDLDHYRGRTCYPEAVQAAEYYLRRQTGVLDLDAYHLREAQEGANGEWQVTFALRQAGQAYRLCIAMESTGVQIRESCRSEKTSPLVRKRLVEFQELD